jgi:hypothetical protein
MRSGKPALVVGAIVYAASFVFVACSGGSDTGTISSSSSGGSSSGESRQPGQSCVTERDADSTSSSSRVCATNPAKAGCKMCLEVENEMTCRFACTLGGSDCPAGQTCTERPGGSSDTQGECDGLGFCK